MHRVRVLALELSFPRDCFGRLWNLGAHCLAYLSIMACGAWSHASESREVTLRGAVALLWQSSLVVAIHRA